MSESSPGPLSGLLVADFSRVLAGPYATCDRRLARDAVRGVAAAYDREPTSYEVDTSAAGVRWGLRNIDRKVAARSWYTLDLTDRQRTLDRLRELRDSPELAGDGWAGTAEVTVDDRVVLVHENEAVYLPIGSMHRLNNPGKIPLELIEVQVGSYTGEDDIIRVEDIYGR